VRIAAAIAGDTAPIRTVLYRPIAEWAGSAEAPSAADGALPLARDRVRWLPWQARTADGKVSDFLAAQKRRDYPDAPSVPLQRARSMTTRPGQEAIRLTGCIAAVFPPG